MTTSAHASRRIYSGATHAPDTDHQEPSSRFSYRDLQPQMYRDQPRRPRRSAHHMSIVNFLQQHDTATCRQISTGLGFTDPRSTMKLLVASPDVFIVVDQVQPEKGAPTQVWGLA